MPKFLATLAICVVAALIYGMAHDQAASRICLEYFTIGRGDIGTKSPTLVGLYWGIVGTWWGGVALGVIIAGVSRWGRGPKVEPREVLLPILYLLLFTMGAAILAGIAGGVAGSNGWVAIVGEVREEIPAGRRTAYLIAHWAHLGSAGAAAIGGVFLAGWIAGRRSEHGRLTAA